MNALDYHWTRPVSEFDDSSICILIVEDDEVYSDLCTRFLRSYRPGHTEVLQARNATEASALYADHEIDCVLIDYTLPDTTGTFLMRSLQPKYDPGVPMIVLTAMSSEEVAIESMHAGAADYLPKKNLSPQALHRAIRNAVEKARLHRSLTERNLELEQANAQLSQKNDEIRRFYHTVSHEIKTPLAAMREFVSIVADEIPGDLNDEQKELLGLAKESCDDIKSLFNDLIDSTRLDTGKLVLQTRRVALHDTIQRSLMSMRGMAQSKGVVLGSRIQDIDALVDLDPGRMCQVVTNVLSNAIKFTPAEGLVTLTARTVEDTQSTRWVEIEVSDTGCGIDPEHLPHIFQRLYQAPDCELHSSNDGLGLGLSIAREIVSLHNGTIDAQSRPGAGTTITIRLPVAVESIDETTMEHANEESAVS